METRTWTAIGMLLLSTTAATATVQAQEAFERLAQAPDPRQDAAQEARAAALLRQSPSLSALRVDEANQPLVRFDVHFGQNAPTAGEARRELARSLFAGLHFGGTGPADPTSPVPGDVLGDVLRDVLVEGPPASGRRPDGYFFDPDADLVVSWRIVPSASEAAAFCFGSSSVTHNYLANTGQTVTYYLDYGTRMVSAAVSTDRYSYANPDLFLRREYTYVDQSTYTNYLDDVMYADPLCRDFWGRLKVVMHAGGRYSLVVTRFFAY